MRATNRLLLMTTALMASGFVSLASAEELTIGLSAEPTSMDPHFHNLVPNNSFRSHIFESLVFQDAKQFPAPGLASQWKALDERTWEFDLRQGVKFSDGTDFDANDVIYSICRIPQVPNSPSSFNAYVANIASIETPDTHTLVIHTKETDPLLPIAFSTWGVISAESNGVTAPVTFKPGGCEGAGAYPTTDDFNSGKAAIGTGPYKLVRYAKGDSIVLEKNPGYWGGAPEWDKVTFKPLTSDGPRVAALLSGDVGVIENPPVQDIPQLERNSDVSVYTGLSNRVIYLFPRYGDAVPPGVEGSGGKNPFADLRVRQALSKAIDRKTIAERVMGKLSIPAGELLPRGMFGARDDADPDSYDPDRAKALLAEAGYPDGFSLVLATPNDRYINDEKIAQAVAQFYARIGIKVSIDASTASQFFSRRNKGEFGFYLAGWGAPTGEMSSPLTTLVHTPDKEKGLGGTNKGNYSNKEVDAVIEEAIATIDDKARSALLQKASKMAMDDLAVIPIHFEVSAWAARKGLRVEPRTDQFMTAMQVTRD